MAIITVKCTDCRREYNYDEKKGNVCPYCKSRRQNYDLQQAEKERKEQGE